MFDQIEENIRKTKLVFVSFIFLATVVGYGIIWSFGAGALYLFWSAVIAVSESFLAYFFGDKLIIKSLNAQPVPLGHNPLLDQVVDEMAIASGLPRPAVYQINTDNLNACAVGRNPQNASIIVTMGMATQLKPDELRGVIAHEMAHIKNWDILYNTVLAALVGGGVVVWRILSDWITDVVAQAIIALVFVSWGGIGALVWSAGLWNPRRFLGYLLLFAAAWFYTLSGRVVQTVFSRNREYLADVQAVELTRFPDGLIAALKKVKFEHNIIPGATSATAHLFLISPEYGVYRSALLDTHPSVEERIERLRNITEVPVQIEDYKPEVVS